MGWFLRKSFGGHGPVRLNVSKSGLGLSVGIKGLRVGTGPRGQYIHGGRHGLYYRKQLGNKRTGEGSPTLPTQQSHDDFTGFESQTTADINQVVVEETAHLVQSINDRMQRFPFWVLTLPFVLALAMGLGQLSGWMGAILAILAFPVSAIVYAAVDVPRKTTILEYDLDAWATERVDELAAAVKLLQASQVRRQVLLQKGHGVDWKRNAGASSLISTAPVGIGKKRPKYIKSNITPSFISCKNQTLFFLPDYLYILKGKKYGVLPYGSLNVEVDTFTMIETHAKPTDTQLLGYTWEKVNKDGSPDRRFASNRQIPRYLYANVDLSHERGFRANFHFSNVSSAKKLVDVFDALGRKRTVQGSTEKQNRPGPAEEIQFSSPKSKPKHQPSAKALVSWSYILGGVGLVSIPFVLGPTALILAALSKGRNHPKATGALILSVICTLWGALFLYIGITYETPTSP